MVPDVRRDSDCWTKTSVSEYNDTLSASNMRKQKTEYKGDTHLWLVGDGNTPPLHPHPVNSIYHLTLAGGPVPHRCGVYLHGPSPGSGRKECRTRTFVRSLYVVSRRSEGFKASRVRYRSCRRSRQLAGVE